MAEYTAETDLEWWVLAWKCGRQGGRNEESQAVLGYRTVGQAVLGCRTVGQAER